eukprot:CAMPEP_0176407688 /NCGR_PEP_ID=MMETSP0127-20121128/1543_1 /TAXON_ID=938130 /ORGANISM="Platyophrya macrostoma, Strain WH" /LENGTH=230 /DNA_ID=CAMNT_0017786907 /DNA_START=58 /DNA_END=748 /DNA_ORIENTATION=-
MMNWNSTRISEVNKEQMWREAIGTEHRGMRVFDHYRFSPAGLARCSPSVSSPERSGFLGSWIDPVCCTSPFARKFSLTCREAVSFSAHPFEAIRKRVALSSASATKDERLGGGGGGGGLHLLNLDRTNKLSTTESTTSPTSPIRATAAASEEENRNGRFVESRSLEKKERRRDNVFSPSSSCRSLEIAASSATKEKLSQKGTSLPLHTDGHHRRAASCGTDRSSLETRSL